MRSGGFWSLRCIFLHNAKNNRLISAFMYFLPGTNLMASSIQFQLNRKSAKEKKSGKELPDGKHNHMALSEMQYNLLSETL